jgi:hypothetical protein
MGRNPVEPLVLRCSQNVTERQVLPRRNVSNEAWVIRDINNEKTEQEITTASLYAAETAAQRATRDEVSL